MRFTAGKGKIPAMSVSIRLSLVGKKGQPVYRIVVCEKRSKRNGQFIDRIGSYDPNINPPKLILDQKKLKEWQEKGANVSTGLYKLLKKQEK